MAQCPSCNKFSALEMQEPEVNDVTLDDKTVSAEVRIVRNSECCGDEMKESTFNTDMEIPDEIAAKMDAILKDAPDAEFEVEDDGVEPLEEGGGRYAKSYYGYSLTVKVTHDGNDLGTFIMTDKVAASGMDELN